MQKLFDTWSIRWSNYSYILRSTGIFWNNLYLDCKELSKCRNANFHTKMYLNTSRNCCKSCRHTLKKKERIEKCNKDFFFWEILVCNSTFVFRTRQSRRSGVFIVNCKDISYLSLMFLLLILNRKWNFILEILKKSSRAMERLLNYFHNTKVSFFLWNVVLEC